MVKIFNLILKYLNTCISITCYKISGGTAEIAVYQLQENNTLAELVLASGGEWGGTNVDIACAQFLKDIFGRSVMETFISDPDTKIDYLEFWQNFEVKKRSYLSGTRTTQMSLLIPLALTDIVKEQMKQEGFQGTIVDWLLKKSKYFDSCISLGFGKLKMSSETFENFFTPTIDKLINHLSKMFQEELDSDVKTILVVGGFSECELVRERLKRHFGISKQLKRLVNELLSKICV